MRCPGASVLCLSPPHVALLLTRLAIQLARTHLSHFDTHGLSRDDIEIGMAKIPNHLGAHPISISIGGLNILHGTGLHSATPYDPPSPKWATEYLASHPAAFDFETLTNPGMSAPYAITSRTPRSLSRSRAFMPLGTRVNFGSPRPGGLLRHRARDWDARFGFHHPIMKSCAAAVGAPRRGIG